MTDHGRTAPDPDGPDWPRLARDLAERGDAAAADLADGTPRGAGRAALVSALAAALHVPDAEPPTDAEVERALADVLARRHLAPPATAQRPMPRQWRVATWSAAAGIVLVAGALLWGRTGRKGATSASVAPGMRVATTGVGQVDSLRLPDGTLAVLGPSSALDTAAGYRSATREVRLRGEAFFDVAHDAAHPFVVRTEGGVLRDVGTSFVVRSDAATGLAVAVRTGAVALRAAEGGAEQLLAAGDRATIARGGEMHIDRGSSTEADVAWTRGQLVLRDAAVPEVREAMRRWYGIDFRVADSALVTRRVTATFARDAGPAAARIIAAAMGGEARFTGDTVLVVRNEAPAAP